MIIDCHYHIEERLLTVDEHLRKMDQNGIDMAALMAPMVEPFKEPPPFIVSMVQFFLTRRPLRWAGRAAVENFTSDGAVKILGHACPIDPDPPNDIVFDAVDVHPDRFLGWVFVNPRGNLDPVAEYEKWKDHPACVGVKAHPFWHRYPPLELVPVARKAASDGKPLLAHVGFGEHGDFYPLLDQVPDLKLILAHAGFPLYSDTWRKIKEMPNVYVDLSQTSYVGQATLKDVVRELGPDRCLYGTDGPFGFHGNDGTFDMGLIKSRIITEFPDASIQWKLLGENFIEVAGITVKQ